jgi:ATP phosphoribosyltransferase regulatory subunit
VGRLAALEHPLPAGMRDLLPREAYRQALLSQRVMSSFELYGYQRVVVPAFEYADVLERGLGSLEADAVLRFVEPETGEVVALRPDMTPQVARLLATRLADVPAPARLCYMGSVLRRRRERARRHRQIPQAGVELLGREGPGGDLEVLSVAAAAVRAAGLSAFVIDLGDARIVSSLLAEVPKQHWREIVEPLSLKDGAAVRESARALGLREREVAALAELPELHGRAEVWARAERLLLGTPAEAAVIELRALWQSAIDLQIAPTVIVDFGETWNFAYYTGPMFQILAEGPGAPVGSGGRYDGLLERFGAARAAAGFAVDLDNLEWALRAAGKQQAEPARVLVSGSEDAVRAMLLALRRELVSCAPAPPGAVDDYAAAWSYSHVLEVQAASATLREPRAAGAGPALSGSAAAIAREVARAIT